MRSLVLRPFVGLIFVVFLVASAALWVTSRQVEPSPQRVDSSDELVRILQDVKEKGEATEGSLDVIEPSGLVNLRVPSVGIDVGFSGETWPRESPYCHGANVCIDPPVMNQAAWYGARALPSVPSSDAVLVYGHSNWNDTSQQVFNDLPAVRQGDVVIADTENGTFIYEAVEPRLIQYEEIPTSEFVYGQEPDKIVLVTCNSKENAGTIVVAYLVRAEPR